ncbi:hypothetical protein AVEN_23617-1 [Araneus ventricosus]|uniref:Uncharacterized protein n=1 Tax=Araneus ventricosus TaxID=182803 RepID=A0A4Y2BK70_ARAVE|nr:hypothetical protein AVEN_23617-1 [Araneus ventricosus]
MGSSKHPHILAISLCMRRKRVKMSVSGRHLAGSEEEKQLLVPNHEMENPSTSSVNYDSMGCRTAYAGPSTQNKNNFYEEPEDLGHEIHT